MSSSTVRPTQSMADALAALAKVAADAGLDPAAARAEGAAFGAAIAESAKGAYVDWGQATGQADSQSFFDAASRGRRWRGAPTAMLSQLVLDGSPHAQAYAEGLTAVSAAACTLGEPTMRVVGNATLAAAAQLSAIRQAQTEASPLLINPLLHLVPPTASQPPGLEALPATPGEGPAMATPDPSAASAAPTEPDPEPAPPTLDELLAELDALIGLTDVKAEIHRQVALLRVESLRSEAGLKSPTMTRHLVFVGNPGTGKTTVARLVGGIYRALGLLTKGQLIEVDRSELVAGYLGQTAMKTADVVGSADGGVLFIDEAYSLAGDQYGTEAVDTLVKEMEDKRDRLVVVVAGYPDPMAMFVAQNPGLASRFRTTIEFADYTDDELVEIFTGLAASSDYDVSHDCVTRFRMILTTTPRGPTFGNGRFARNLLEAAIGHQAWRLRDVEHPTVDQLRTLLPDDLDDGRSEPTDTARGAGSDTGPTTGAESDLVLDRGRPQEEPS